MSDMKWQGSARILGIVKSEEEKKIIFQTRIFYGCFLRNFPENRCFSHLSTISTTHQPKEKDFIMTASATASNNRKVVSAGIIAERAVVCTCNARNDENVFSNIEVAGLILAGKSIANAEFHYSKVTDAVFENCDINYGEFKFAVLENVTFVNCKLERSYFNFSSLDNVKFVNCLLDSSEFNFASGKVVFENCSLKFGENDLCHNLIESFEKMHPDFSYNTEFEMVYI